MDSLNVTHQNNNNIQVDDDTPGQRVSTLEAEPEDNYTTPEDNG